MIADLKPYPAYKDSGVPWLGEVPEHWDVRRTRYIFREIDARSTTGEETQLSMTQAQGLVESAKVDTWRMRSESYVGGKLCQPNDLILNRLKAHLGVFAHASIAGVISPDYSVFRPITIGETRYFEQILRTPLCVAELRRNTKGIVEGFWRLYTDEFYDIRVPVPPPEEQSAIVRFLDHYDRKIRRYILAKQKLIKLLEEQKQAIIHRAVTRGLDPNVHLKPSGVEWLGDVPEHWEVRRLGQLSLSFRTGPFGSILHQSDYVEGGIPIINPTHMSHGEIVEDTWCSVSSAMADRLSYYRLDKWDLIFSRRGELGRCALVRDRETGWLCGTGSIRVRIGYDGIEPEYLIQALQVRWVGEYLSLFSVGATMGNLNTGILKGVPVLVPPVNEQQALLERISQEAQSIDRATTDTEREIDLLREYRTRLIADVVTGKLDVRGVIEAGNDLRSYPGLPEEDGALDGFDPGEDTEAEEVVDNGEEALDE